jgi:hypothetical protein
LTWRAPVAGVQCQVWFSDSHPGTTVWRAVSHRPGVRPALLHGNPTEPGPLRTRPCGSQDRTLALDHSLTSGQTVTDRSLAGSSSGSAISAVFVRSKHSKANGLTKPSWILHIIGAALRLAPLHSDRLCQSLARLRDQVQLPKSKIRMEDKKTLTSATGGTACSFPIAA